VHPNCWSHHPPPTGHIYQSFSRAFPRYLSSDQNLGWVVNVCECCFGGPPFAGFVGSILPSSDPQWSLMGIFIHLTISCWWSLLDSISVCPHLTAVMNSGWRTGHGSA
jgi:hypothetical protein